MHNKNINKYQGIKPASTFIIALLMLIGFNTCFAADSSGIVIQQANISQQKQTYLLNTDITYTLNKKVVDALNNGITLTFNVEIRLVSPRPWIWDKHLNVTRLPFQIKYNTLAQTYQINDKTNHRKLSFSSLESALHALGTLSDIPLHALSTEKGSPLIAKLKVYLNIEALPLPMRPLSYATPSWHLRSNTYLCPLKP